MSPPTCASRPQSPQEAAEQYQARLRLAERMAKVKHKSLVFSGKGGRARAPSSPTWLSTWP